MASISVSESPYRGLSAEQRDAARTVADRTPHRLALISGSVAAGLGHAKSDVDIHLVIDEKTQIDRRTTELGPHRVQITLVEESTVRAAVERTRSFNVTRTARGQAYIEGRELWHFIRLCSAEVIDGEPQLITLFQAIDRHVARQILMALHATEVARAADDALGMLESGAEHGAYGVAQIALVAALEAALAARGDLYALPKFLWPRLDRSAAFEPIRKELWRSLRRGPDWNAEQIPARTDKLLRLAQQLVADALVHGWGAVPKHTRLLSQGHGPVRNPYVGLLRFADSWALTRPSGPLRANENVANVWAACTGQSENQLVAELDGNGIAVDNHELRSVLRKLGDAGVLASPNREERGGDLDE